MDFHRRNMLHSKEKLGTGCEELDQCLQGGISTREICEISGESSSGKTQLCLQLLVKTVCSHAHAVYFHTEGDPPLHRLQQIAHNTIEKGGLEFSVDSVLDHVYMEHSFDREEDLYHRIVNVEELLIRLAESEAPVKVLIVDSIAYMFRDLDPKAMATALSIRSSFFFKIASLLRKYADVYNLAVVVTNHAVDLFDTEQDENECTNTFIESFPGCAGLELESSGRLLYPALGLSWSNCITTRLFTSKEAVKDESGGINPVVYTGSIGRKTRIDAGKGSPMYPQVRGMQIVFSPDLPQNKCHFIIGEAGCHGISHSQLENSTVILSQTRV